MKTFLKLASGAAIGALMVGQASAADVYNKGSTKDGMDFYESKGLVSWNGWYLTGKLGVSKQEYEGRRTYDGELGIFDTNRRGEDGCDAANDDACFIDGKWVGKPAGGWGTYNPDADNTLAADAPVRHDYGVINWAGAVPFELDSDQNLDGGLEISRVIRAGGLVLEPYVAGSMPLGDSSTTVAYAYDAPVKLHDSLGGAPLGALPAVGVAEVEKQFDVSAGLKVGFTVDRLYVFGGAGVNWGFFNSKGFNDLAGAGATSPFRTGFDQDDDAIGYELLLGAKYALNERILLGVEGSWKQWTGIEAGSSRSTDIGAPGNPGQGIYVDAGGKNEVDASEWTVKGTVSIKVGE